MKKAIGYTRISTKDQSNFSLDGQEKYVRDFCEKQDYELIATFQDEGQSAKNFDRPDWRALEKFIEQNHQRVDVLLVCKYDRFSRNLSEALNMIEQLEKKFSIRVMSVMEHIPLHPASPFYFQMRAQMLLGAQMEWLMIKDRTKFGIRQAGLNGRYINRAPIGYVNLRDEHDRPIIEIDENRAPAIREIFRLYLLGTPLKQIGRLVKSMGYTSIGNSSIQRVLENPTYGGLIQVTAYYDEPGKLTKGIHQGLISEDVWWKTQALVTNSKNPQLKVKYNDDVPLRGALKCHCGRILTAGNSKGKRVHVWYYRCHTHNENLNAKKLHIQFDELLHELELSPTHIKYMEDELMEKIKSTVTDQDRQIKQKQNELKAVLQKIESVEEKFLNNTIDNVTYEKWHHRILIEKSILDANLSDLKTPLEERWKFYDENLSKLGDLHHVFTKAQINEKHSIIHAVFNNSLSYQDGIYRTPYLLPIFDSKVLTLREKKLLEVEQLVTKNQKLMECSGIGS